MAKRKRDERGVYALLTAIMAVLLITVAAMAVDIGNAVARKSDVQGQADFAALAAASQITTSSGTIPTSVLDAVRVSMNDNQPTNRNGACVSTTESCVTSNTQLTDANLNNGEVRWANGGLEVITPQEKVDYGFAKVMGYNSTNVTGRATVGVFSPGSPSPFYATPACGYGIQTLKDNSGGLSLDVTVPPLNADSDTNAANLSNGAVDPPQVSLNASGVEVKVTGSPNSAMSNVTAVGFFRSDPGVLVSAPINGSAAAGQVKVTVPDAVTAVEDVWYIRVKIGSSWSKREDALSFQVGDAVLQCDPGSSSGNFGTIDLPGWNGNTNSDIAMNIAAGLKAPLTLTKYPDPIPAGFCSTADSRTVYSAGGPYKPNTNCAQTQPGLRSVAVTPGYLTGVGSYKGRLDRNTSSKCTAEGRSTRGSLTGFGAGVNDDVLTCFFTNTTTSIATIASPSYAGPAVLDSSIYDSPRFVWVPLFGFDPGGTKLMHITGFRPGFITDQPTGATRANMLTTTETENGLVMKNGSLRAIRVIFFDEDALPSKTGGTVSDYFGVGPRIIRMID